MNFARSMALLSSLGISIPLLAATEFEDGLVPAEVAREFIGGTLYSSLPDGFPVPEMPGDSGLSILGSLDRGQINQQVLLRNSGSWESARATLRGAYLGTGWLDIGPSDSPSSITDASSRLSLCHDELGFLDFYPTGADKIRANRNSMPPSTRIGALDCAQLKAQGNAQGGGAGTFAFAAGLMPVLEYPEGAQQPGFPGASIGMSTASGNGLNFRIDRDGSFTVSESSVAELYEHFAPQLEGQDWELDSAALGSSSSASIWFRTAQTPDAPGSTVQDLELTGIMNILQIEDDHYRLLFRLMSTDDGAPRGIDALGPPLNAPELGIRGIPVDPASGMHSFSGGNFISAPPVFLP